MKTAPYARVITKISAKRQGSEAGSSLRHHPGHEEGMISKVRG